MILLPCMFVPGKLTLLIRLSRWNVYLTGHPYLMVPDGIMTLLQPLCHALYQLQVCCYHLPGDIHPSRDKCNRLAPWNPNWWFVCMSGCRCEGKHSRLTCPVTLCSRMLQMDLSASTITSWSEFSEGGEASFTTSLDTSAASPSSPPSPSPGRRQQGKVRQIGTHSVYI